MGVCVTVQTEQCKCNTDTQTTCPLACNITVPVMTKSTGLLARWRTTQACGFKAEFKGYTQAAVSSLALEIAVINKLQLEYDSFVTRRKQELETLGCTNSSSSSSGAL